MKLRFIFTILALLWGQQLLAQAVTHLSPEDAQNPENLNLSDRDRWTSETYVHQGYIDRQKEEECNKLSDPNACRGRGKTQVFGTDSQNVEMIAKAYTMVIGMTDLGSFTKKPKTSETAKTETGSGTGTGTGSTAGSGSGSGEGKGSGSEQKDYCKYIAIAGEMIGTMTQQMEQNKLTEVPVVEGTEQKASLYKAAQSHETRAKTAKTQAVTWGATAACYTYMATAGNIVFDWSIGLKLVSSYILTKFYADLSEEHKKHADDVKAIANKLKGPGDCNPITDKPCYCAQPETMYDPKHCLNNNVAGLKVKSGVQPVTCIDANMKDDPQCNCVGQDNCYDKILYSELDASGYGKALIGTPLANDLKNLTRGQLQSGAIGRATTASNQAIALLKQKADSAEDTPLNEKQNKIAEELKKFGLDRISAKKFAAAPTTSAMKTNANKFRGRLASRGRYSSRYTSSRGKNGKVLTFGNGSGLSASRKKSRRGSNDFSKYLNRFKKKKRGSQNRGKVLNFANKATRSAQITKDKGRPIFEIISRRYQTSAWRRLDID